MSLESVDKIKFSIQLAEELVVKPVMIVTYIGTVRRLREYLKAFKDVQQSGVKKDAK